MAPEYLTAEQLRKLPPLSLHPFSDSSSPNKLMQGSRASLMLQGILPNEELSFDQMQDILLEGRVCEIRMLYYVGKDLLRWIEQCVEFVISEKDLRNAGIEAQTFATLLIDDAPLAVRTKLQSWGVQDYRAIFTRGLGLNAVFGEAPSTEQLTPDFIRNYHTYADEMYAVWARASAFVRIRPDQFEFELFASAEYSRMLERQWTNE
jgi:hypothetical protein